MKKHVSILLGLLVFFSSLFTSCNNEDELDPNICKITVNSEGNGTVSITDYIGTSVNVLIGNQVEVVATPDDGWAFTGWYANGTETPISTDAAFTFTTSESVTLTARFAKLSDIIIRSGGNGRVAFKGATGNSIPVVPGTEVTVIATPNTDCDFVGWFVGDSETPISTENVYTFTATENLILTGKFSKRPIVTVHSTGNGSVSIEDTNGTSKAFLPGTEVTVIATPNENCDFIGWFVADAESPVSTDIEYTFEVIEDIALTAKFSKRPVVTLYSTAGGSVSIKNYSDNSIVVLPGTEVTIIAVSNENCDFTGWYVVNTNTLVSVDSEYTSAVTNDMILIAKFTTPVGEAIDLGLSVKWASFNVGASRPEEPGGYYAWGEREEKGNYDLSTYKWYKGSNYTMTKYCDNDDKTILEPYDDVAVAKWGGNWRMPTVQEFKELRQKCTWLWTSQNGINGYTVTGPNGNSIFLPVTGYREDTELYSSDNGSYWSSSLFNSYDLRAELLFFTNSSYTCGSGLNSDRYVGLCVRPVYD